MFIFEHNIVTKNTIYILIMFIRWCFIFSYQVNSQTTFKTCRILLMEKINNEGSYSLFLHKYFRCFTCIIFFLCFLQLFVLGFTLTQIKLIFFFCKQLLIICLLTNSQIVPKSALVAHYSGMLIKQFSQTLWMMWLLVIVRAAFFSKI